MKTNAKWGGAEKKEKKREGIHLGKRKGRGGSGGTK